MILEWHKLDGVLLMGYELYRQLALKNNNKKKNKKPKERKKDLNNPHSDNVIDIEDQDKNKDHLDGES